ncbi:MAG TPA: phosphoglucosamine mutase [Phycisphaerae bacterium]|nr:phosphoglucosamine mutase [Phycisphaerae bacterium]HRW53867.1 phosphoglucosamine mutase [Phycisphaerae bacterium]
MTLIMSVSGVRGIVGQTMTPRLAADLGAAFGTFIGGGKVVIGRDSRPSGPMLQHALAAGLLATGCDVVTLDVVTTPGVALMIGEHGAAGGVVLTASHNPTPWNGIKFLTSQGFAPPPADAERIFGVYHASDFALKDALDVGRIQSDDSTHRKHVERVLRIVDVEAIRARRFKVVLDSVNGAGGPGGRQLLDALGCDVVHLNAEPTGRFAHTPEPTKENLTGLCDAVREHGAQLGFAQDPDADRLAIVDNLGRYIGEEFTVALTARHRLATAPGPVAVNLSTSRMVDDIAASVGGDARVVRTAVGEANVAHAIMNDGCVMGGEGNGGVIDPRVVCVRDSFAGMGLVLDLLAAEGKPLDTIVDSIPQYVMVKTKFEMPRDQIDAWLNRARGIADGKVNDADGLRIDWPEGWVHLRPSNTEPIARVISEAADAATANALVERMTALRG